VLDLNGPKHWLPALHDAMPSTDPVRTKCSDHRLDAAGQTARIAAGDVVVAPAGAVHRVLNTGALAPVFGLVASPALAGGSSPFDRRADQPRSVAASVAGSKLMGTRRTS
jgi:hypothetical protein